MAMISYESIRQEIANIIRDSSLDVFTEMEKDVNIDPDKPWVVVYLETRNPPDNQPIAAGTRIRYEIRYTVVVYVLRFEDEASAADKRDSLIAEIEKLMMQNRTLNNNVSTLWLEGGDFDSARDEDGNFVSAGEVRIVTVATADTAT